MTDAARIMDLEQMNAVQADLIKRLWVQNEQMQKRIDKLQPIADWRQARIDELEAAQTPEAQAERIFKHD